MLALLGVATLFSILVSLVLGVRLLHLASRTRGTPELVVGSAFLVAGFLGYGLAVVGNPGSSPLPAPWAERAFVPGMLLVSVGVCLNYLFIQQVFRPGPGWGRWLMLGGSALTLLTAWTQFEVRAGVAEAGWLYRLGDAARMGVGAWGAAEGLRYWTLMRRRQALGLAEPVVANRFLLWGLAALSTLGIFLVNVLFATPGEGAMSAGFLGGISVLILIASAFQWLAFFPPAAYLRWVEGGRAAPASA